MGAGQGPHGTRARAGRAPPSGPLMLPGRHQSAAYVAAPRTSFDVSRTDRLPARPTHEDHVGGGPAPLVGDLQGWPRRGGVVVSPLPHGRQHGPEVPALVGEPVVVTRGMV